MPTELPDTMSLAIAATARIAEDIHLFELRAREDGGKAGSGSGGAGGSSRRRGTVSDLRASR